MAYPEQGATYRRMPAWIDRMKRAEGGEVGEHNAPIAGSSFTPSKNSPFLPLKAQSGDLPEAVPTAKESD